MTMRRLAPLALAAASLLGILVLLDWTVARLGLDYVAARGRPLEDRRLVREEFAVDVRLNELGFREARLPGPKAVDSLRIVALGDSFTQGFGVDAAVAWPTVLEGLLNADDASHRHEVVNLGVPGTNPIDYLAHLRDPGLAYAPDLVIVTVMANDIQDRWMQRRFGVTFASGVLLDARRAVLTPPSAWATVPRAVLPTLYPFVRTRLGGALRGGDAPQPSATPPAPVVPAGAARAILDELAARFGRRDDVARLSPAALDALAPVLVGTVALDDPAATEPYLRVMALVQPRLFADAVLLPATYDDAWHDVADRLTQIVAATRRAGAVPVMVFAPAVQQVTSTARPYLERLGFTWEPRTLNDTTLPDRLRELAADTNTPFVDLLPVLRAHRDETLYFPHDGHWTPHGHALVAATIGSTVAGALAATPTSQASRR